MLGIAVLLRYDGREGPDCGEWWTGARPGVETGPVAADSAGSGGPG